MQETSRTVHRCCIAERKFCLCLNAGEAELLCHLVPLFQIAFFTRKRQIRDTITASANFRHDMLYLEWYTCFLTICAFMLPFQEQIFFDLKTRQCTKLVLSPLDLWMLQRLCIEAHSLIGKCTN